jgi:LacI family transcriptional regulator
MQQLMMLPDPPSAILTINIAQLLGTMAGLKTLGMRVPDDVSVASFDGFHPAEGWFPGITTLMQNVAGVSAKASEFLLERINGSAESPRIARVPPSLQIRESCRSTT